MDELKFTERGRTVRKGYAIKFQGNGLTADLVCPAGGNRAWMEKLTTGSYYVECRFTSKEPHKIIESELPDVMDAWTESARCRMRSPTGTAREFLC